MITVMIMEEWRETYNYYHVGRGGNEIERHSEKVPEDHTPRFVIQK